LTEAERDRLFEIAKEIRDQCFEPEADPFKIASAAVKRLEDERLRIATSRLFHGEHSNAEKA
jgi:hypothetical protein